MRDGIHLADATTRRTRLWPAIGSTLAVLFSRIDRDDAHAFFDAVATGVDLGPGDGRRVLRDRLTEGSNLKPKPLPQREQAGLTIKAWNAWREGREIRTLWWRSGGSKPEAFPKIHGWEYGE